MRVKGTFKEQVGKATKDRVLKAEGKSEKRVGKVQQQLGRARDAVAQLKMTLKQSKAAVNLAHVRMLIDARRMNFGTALNGSR